MNKKNLSIYKEFLLQNNLKSTKPRSVIFDTFLKTKGHISAEDLCAVIKRTDPSIGQATVYRMLKLLIDFGIARKLDMGDGVIMYELETGERHHDHLICEECFNYIEFKDDRIEELQLELAQKYGFSLTGHKMFLYGQCRSCRQKK